MAALVGDRDVVVHLAASFFPEDLIEDIVVAGTANLLTASKEADISRVIFMSCLGAEAAAHSSFLRAKWKAEQLVRAADLPHLVLRPSLILGRGDGFTAPLAYLIRSLPVIPVPGKGLTRSQPIDVGDVVRAVMTSLDCDELSGVSVSLGGPMFLTFRQLVDLVSGALGVFKSKLLIPAPLLPTVTAVVPAPARSLFAPARRAVYSSGVVSSPGVVQSHFGFEPRSVVPLLASYTD
jgi:NADH dehydrogenase